LQILDFCAILGNLTNRCSMAYNFDEIISRENTDCVKYDFRKQLFGSDDVIPMWVADMDFKTPDFIVDALKARMDHPIFGYPVKPEAYFTSQIKWLMARHQWEVQREWIQFCQGVVPALNLIVLAFTDPGDEIIVQPPVYYPFFSAIKNNHRVQVDNPLIYQNGRYSIDFDDLEKKIDTKTRILFLCHPQNPGGRSWRVDELTRLAGICMKNDLLIISDEIHSDLVLPGYKHVPMASISTEIADCVITCIAPSKTFNIAGLGTSSVIISNPGHREKFQNIMERIHIGMGNILGITASIAAYTHGAAWLMEVMQYIQGNVDLVAEFCRSRIPKIKPMIPEATYLVWLDCRDLGFSNEELRKFMIEKVKVGFNDGPTFGAGGDGFQRMNVGCPRNVVREALDRMEKAIGEMTG
jgi:cystathionine beta-lyase